MSAASKDHVVASDQSVPVERIPLYEVYMRMAEELAKRARPASADSTGGARRGRAASAADADVAALERQLGDLLGLKVKVASDGHRGTVTLHYSSLDQLDMICQRLSGEPI